MTRVSVTSLLLPCGLVAAVVAQSGRLPLLAVFCAAVAMSPLAGYVGGKHRVGIAPVRDEGPVRYVGDQAVVQFRIRNLGRTTMPVTTVMLTSRGLDLLPVSVPELRSGESVVVAQTLALGSRRGAEPFTAVVRLHNRLAGSDRTLRVSADTPGLFAVRPWPDRPPPRLLARLSRPSDDGYGTGHRGNADPLLLRKFTAGDPVSSVHWRSTARLGSPVVMEREQLASGTLTLVVASAGVGYGWEGAVCRAAGMVGAAAELGVPVRVLAAAPALGTEGAVTHESVHEWLAALETSGGADRALVADAVRASAGLLVVLSADPQLAPAIVAAGAPADAVVDLMTTSW